MINDVAYATGAGVMVLTGPDGQVKQRLEFDNLIVTSGRNWRAERLTGVPAVMSHMAIGTSATAPALGDTALGAEVARVALASAVTVDNVTTYQASFGPGVGTGAIVEAGILNAAALGTLLNRATFGVMTKEALDSLSITWAVTQQ